MPKRTQNCDCLMCRFSRSALRAVKDNEQPQLPLLVDQQRRLVGSTPRSREHGPADTRRLFVLFGDDVLVLWFWLVCRRKLKISGNTLQCSRVLQLQTNATMLIFTCVCLRACVPCQFGIQRLREDTELNISKSFQTKIRPSVFTESSRVSSREGSSSFVR